MRVRSVSNCYSDAGYLILQSDNWKRTFAIELSIFLPVGKMCLQHAPVCTSSWNAYRKKRCTDAQLFKAWAHCCSHRRAKYVRIAVISIRSKLTRLHILDFLYCMHCEDIGFHQLAYLEAQLDFGHRQFLLIMHSHDDDTTKISKCHDMNRAKLENWNGRQSMVIRMRLDDVKLKAVRRSVKRPH